MDNMIPYEYQTTTPDFSLKIAVVEPKIVKSVADYCKVNRCYPYKLISAKYMFVKENGQSRTYYFVKMEMVEGKGTFPVSHWFKQGRIPWEFTAPEEHPAA